MHYLFIHMKLCMLNPPMKYLYSAKFLKIHSEMEWVGLFFISDSYCSLKLLWSGMGEEVKACTSPTLHPPSPSTVL